VSGSPDLFDHAIAGAGMAGLSLALAITERFPREHLLIADDEWSDADDRTLSYFSARPLPLDGIATRAFDRVTVGGGTDRLELPLTRYRYRSLRGVDFRRAARARLAGNPNVSLVTASVDRLEDRGDHAAMIAGPRTFRARWGFDGRAAARPAAGRHDRLVQRFVGWEIELDRPVLDPSSVSLFDFVEGGPARFHYRLPWSHRVGLFEVVTFGAPAREQDLADHIARSFPGVAYRVLRREGGQSLLTTAPFARGRGRVIAIGVAGGMVRPSTGYALTRIVDDTEAIVAALAEGRHPPARVRRSPLHQLFDAVFLHLAAHRPERLPAVFRALFTRNPVERVLRLLDGPAGPRDLVAIVLAAAPRRLLLSALAGWIGMRVGLRRRALPPR
jgi:lycopene beta-cyclase